MRTQCIDAALTLAQLRKALNYDPTTGVFIWLHRPRKHFRNAHGWNTFNSKYAGKQAGCLSPAGYVKIRINNGLCRADRLAYAHMTGRWPDQGIDVDHIDGNRANDRWSNLRLASRSQTNMNQKLRSDSTSGWKGVSFDKRAQKWIAQIKANNRHIHLGTFKTPELAHAAYCEAAVRYFGEFARFE